MKYIFHCKSIQRQTIDDSVFINLIKIKIYWLRRKQELHYFEKG